MLVSIYMPTKNRVESLACAVNSVLSQTYQNIELIVTDDASTDGTADYLSALAQRDPRVKFIRNEVSKGACHARNSAIKLSKGEFLTGLDDDDEFLPHHISALMEYWHLLTQYYDHPVSCLYSQHYQRQNDVFSEGRRISAIDYRDLFRTNQLGNQIFAPRSHYFEAGLFDEEMPAWQDLEFFFRVLKKFGPARLLDLPTYVFDVSPRPDRISVGQKAKITKACDRMIKLHANGDKRVIQQLILQIHADHYGFPTTIGDLVRFAKQGFWPRAYWFLLQKIVKTYFPFLKTHHS